MCVLLKQMTNAKLKLVSHLLTDFSIEDLESWLSMAMRVWEQLLTKKIGFHRSRSVTPAEAVKNLELDLFLDSDITSRIPATQKEKWVNFLQLRQSTMAKNAPLLARKLAQQEAAAAAAAAQKQ